MKYLSIELVLIFALAFGFVGWYGAFAAYNRYKTNKILKIITTRLSKYGLRGELYSLGSSGFILIFDEPTKNIKSLSIASSLAKRELPINWLIDHLRGKRDEIVIKVVLRNAPRVNIDLFRKKSYYGKILNKRLNINSDAMNSIIIHPHKRSKIIDRVERLMKNYSGIWWISLRSKGINITLNSDLNIINNIETVMETFDKIG